MPGPCGLLGPGTWALDGSSGAWRAPASESRSRFQAHDARDGHTSQRVLACQIGESRIGHELHAGTALDDDRGREAP